MIIMSLRAVLSPGRKRASGGSGGYGGNVYIVADNSLTSFTFETSHFNAGDGKHGGSMIHCADCCFICKNLINVSTGAGLTGRNGKDVYIRVPCGTIVTDRKDSYEDDLSGLHCSSTGDGYEEEEDSDNNSDDDVNSNRKNNTENEKKHKDDEDSDGSDDGPLGEWVPVESLTPRQLSQMSSSVGVQEDATIRKIDLSDHGTTILVARGGKPGAGNMAMKNQKIKNQRAAVVSAQ